MLVSTDDKLKAEESLNLYLEFLNRQLLSFTEDFKRISQLIEDAIRFINADIDKKTNCTKKLRDDVEL